MWSPSSSNSSRLHDPAAQRLAEGTHQVGSQAVPSETAAVDTGGVQAALLQLSVNESRMGFTLLRCILALIVYLVMLGGLRPGPVGD